VLLQAGVEFIDDAEVIGVRVVRPAKPEALQLRKRRPRNPKKSV